MDMEQKNQLVEQYINSVALRINSQYRGLMDDDKIASAIEMFKDSSDDLRTEIIPKINELAQKVIDNFIEFQNYLKELMIRKQQESLDELATLELGTDVNGIYLSQQQIDLLIITDIKSASELKNFVENICGQFPFMKVQDIIEDFDLIANDEQLEEAKRILYQKYQDSIIDYLSYAKMSDIEKARVKLEKVGVKGEELEFCLSQVSLGKIDEAFQYLGQKYGSDFITKFNRLMNDDFENVKSVSYDEMKSLSDLIKRDTSIDTIIIATGKFDNSVFQTLNGKVFDPYFTSKALEFCYVNGKHMRYHSLFDHFHVDSLLKQGKGRQDHDQILTEMKDYIKMSMDFIEKNNRRLADGTMLINEIEVFNELVEKHKRDKNSDYEMVWEKYFGITVPEIISCFDGIKKPDGVEFMYNETTLTESPQKRVGVEKVLYQIERIAPSLIDRFGDQMHLSDEDVMTEIGRRNLEETAQMLKRIQDGSIMVEGKLEQIIPKKLECTEHDFHFTKEFIDKIKIVQANNGNVDIWSVKRGMQDVIGKIYSGNGVGLERSTYWSLFGKNDHNLCRANIKIQKENMDRKKKRLNEQPLMDTMLAGIIKDGKTFKDVESLKSEKNRMVTQQKQVNKGKTLVRTKTSRGSSSSGFVNILTLTLMVGFLIGVIFIVVYMVAK